MDKSETEKRAMVVADGCNRRMAERVYLTVTIVQLNGTLPKLQCDDLLYDGSSRQLVIYSGMSQVDQKTTMLTQMLVPKCPNRKETNCPWTDLCSHHRHMI